MTVAEKSSNIGKKTRGHRSNIMTFFRVPGVNKNELIAFKLFIYEIVLHTTLAPTKSYEGKRNLL